MIETTFRRPPRRRNADFVNTYYDDNLWWGLAWVAAYDLTGDGRYLDAARVIFERCLDGWDDTCGGGLWWSRARTYKNAITNELFLTLAARLHQRVPGDQYYLDWALRDVGVVRGQRHDRPGGLVNDGLTADCARQRGHHLDLQPGRDPGRAGRPARDHRRPGLAGPRARRSPTRRCAPWSPRTRPTRRAS